jgi:hypothetical protein
MYQVKVFVCGESYYIDDPSTTRRKDRELPSEDWRAEAAQGYKKGHRAALKF